MRFSTQRLEQLLIIGAENTAPAPQEGDVVGDGEMGKRYGLERTLLQLFLYGKSIEEGDTGALLDQLLDSGYVIHLCHMSEVRYHQIVPLQVTLQNVASSGTRLADNQPFI